MIVIKITYVSCNLKEYGDECEKNNVEWKYERKTK